MRTVRVLSRDAGWPPGSAGSSTAASTSGRGIAGARAGAGRRRPGRRAAPGLRFGQRGPGRACGGGQPAPPAVPGRAPGSRRAGSSGGGPLRPGAARDTPDAPLRLGDRSGPPDAAARARGCLAPAGPGAAGDGPDRAERSRKLGGARNSAEGAGQAPRRALRHRAGRRVLPGRDHRARPAWARGAPPGRRRAPVPTARLPGARSRSGRAAPPGERRGARRVVSAACAGWPCGTSSSGSPTGWRPPRSSRSWAARSRCRCGSRPSWWESCVLGPRVTGQPYGSETRAPLHAGQPGRHGGRGHLALQHRPSPARLHRAGPYPPPERAVTIDAAGRVTRSTAGRSRSSSCHSGDVLEQDLRVLPSPLGDLSTRRMRADESSAWSRWSSPASQTTLEVSTSRIVDSAGAPCGAVMLLDTRGRGTSSTGSARRARRSISSTACCSG